MLDPLTGQKVDLVDLTDAFILPDPKACLIDELPKAASLPSNFQQAQKAKLKTNFSAGKAPLQLDDDLTSARRVIVSPGGRVKVLPAKVKQSAKDLNKAARNRQDKQDIIEDADGSETRQIFIFRSGDKPTVEIVDLEIPINEAGKPVYGDKYKDAVLEDFQEKGGIVIPDNQVPDVANGVFDLDSGYVSELLNDIGLSSELISNLQEGNFTGSVFPEINLSGFELGHIASGFVTGDFPNYLDDLDGLGIYHLDSLPVLVDISETF